MIQSHGNAKTSPAKETTAAIENVEERKRDSRLSPRTTVLWVQTPKWKISS